MREYMEKLIWALITIILMMSEAFIFYVSHIHSTNTSALGYITFAGTIVSIILAILAIGYTYGESVVNKSNSQNIQTYITELKEAVHNIQDIVENNNLENIKSEIDDSLGKLSSLSNDLQETVKNKSNV
jgi:Na+/melibiose symporter-like transporter